MNLRRTGLSLLALCVATSAWAQFRDRPMSEAERLAKEGEEYVADGAKKLADGDKQGALDEYKSALERFQKALEQDPNLAQAARGIGAAGVALGNNELVVKKLQPFHAAHPEVDEVAFSLGVAAYKLRQFDVALPALEQVAPKDTPENAPYLLSHYYLGQLYLAQGRGERAAAELTRYLQVRPKKVAGSDGEIYTMLGQAYLMLKRPNEARTAYTYAQTGRPESVPVQLGLASVLELEGKTQDATAFLNALVGRQPKSAEARERLGRLLLTAKKVPEAEGQANELLKLGDTANARHLVGDVKLAKGDVKGAEADLRKAVQMAPQAVNIQVSLARSLIAQKRNDEAVALLENAAKTQPTVEVYAALGTVARRAGQYQKAIEAHEKVIAQIPGSPRGHLLIGADRYAIGEWDLAIDSYGQALKLAPEEPNAKHWLALCLNHRARARSEKGRLEDAARDLRRAFDLEPLAITGLNLGAVALAQKNPTEARQALTRASALPGATWRHQLLLGYAALADGDAAASVTAFEQAAKLTQEDIAQSEIYAGWALAKLELGEFEVALQRLNEQGKSKAAISVLQGNLPIALVRRALAAIRAGKVDDAEKDLAAVEKLRTSKVTDTTRLIDLARALSDIERGRHGQAVAGFKKSLGGATFTAPQALSYFTAYAEYRRGEPAAARKQLQTALKGAGKPEKEWAASLTKAIDRRDGELSYLKGNLPGAEKALKAAGDADPLNPYVIANKASVAYRKNQRPAALKGWQQVEDAIPEAAANLGIAAQEKGDASEAVDHYAKYLAANGGRSGQVREWVDRLVSLYGLKAPAAAPATDAEPSATAPAAGGAEGSTK